MQDMEEQKENLFEIYKKYDYFELRELFKMAKTKEEQDFYVKVSDFLLQKRQLEVIEGKNIRAKVDRAMEDYENGRYLTAEELKKESEEW